jgi:flagellin
MALTVNTNIASLTAQRNLTGSQSDLATSLERLSSGLRINSARDDAAGLAISARFEAQIRGLDQGVRNANDAISLSQTAEGALGEVTSNLQRIRELAVQSANATNSANDRATLQAEVTQLVAEIDRVATASAFNGIKLLDGTFSAQSFQVGANVTDTVTVSNIVNTRSTSLGADTIAVGGSTKLGGTSFNSITGGATAVAAKIAAGANAVIGDTDLVLTSGGASTSNINYAAGSSAAQLATAINSATSSTSTGITASATNTAYLGNFTGLANGDTVAFVLTTGGSVELGEVSISETISDAGDLSSIVNSINANSTTLGVTASQVTLATGVALKIDTTDGRDVQVSGFLSTGADTAKFGGDVAFTSAATLGAAVGTDSANLVGQVTLSGSKGAITMSGQSGDFDVTSSTKSALSALSISTAAAASTALSTIDAALDTINSARGDLGAYQNRFESVVANLQVTSENLSASRSRIMDADFAAETASLTKAQILQQSGIAMLAQANSIPQNVLALLQ